ncbi:hypothetical protein GAMM_10057 [Gammaproteobacteria bacterium]
MQPIKTTDGVVKSKPKKGIIVLDLDGTALVQKIDKNPAYGIIQDTESNIRQALVKYISLAEEAGYDIYILTARPKIVEPLLSGGKIGTKSTDEIVNWYESAFGKDGPKIKGVERVTGGLKGPKMKEMLENYRRTSGNKDAEAILIDDQLKQVESVREQKVEGLYACDINGFEDMKEFYERCSSKPLYSDKDLERILGKDFSKKEDFKKNYKTFYGKEFGLEITPANKEAIRKKLSDERYLDGFYPENIVNCIRSSSLEFGHKTIEENWQNLERSLSSIKDEKIHALIDGLCKDLAMRLFEAEYRNYQPELESVSKAIKELADVAIRLQNANEIDVSYAENLSQSFFGKNNPEAVKPNTQCEVKMKEVAQVFKEIARKNLTDGMKNKNGHGIVAGNLKNLEVSLLNINDKEIRGLIHGLCRELDKRLLKAEYRQPELGSVSKAIKELADVAIRLQNADEVDMSYVENLSQSFFGKNDPEAVKPNTQCEVKMKEIALTFEKVALINEIRKECEEYLNLCNKDANITDADKKEKREIIQKFMDVIPNWSKSRNNVENSIEKFAKSNNFKEVINSGVFSKNEKDLAFLERVKFFLIKLLNLRSSPLFRFFAPREFAGHKVVGLINKVEAIEKKASSRSAETKQAGEEEKPLRPKV